MCIFSGEFLQALILHNVSISQVVATAKEQQWPKQKNKQINGSFKNMLRISIPKYQIKKVPNKQL